MIYIWLFSLGMSAIIAAFKLDQHLNMAQIVILITGATIYGYMYGEYKESQHE